MGGVHAQEHLLALYCDASHSPRSASPSPSGAPLCSCGSRCSRCLLPRARSLVLRRCRILVALELRWCRCPLRSRGSRRSHCLCARVRSDLRWCPLCPFRSRGSRRSRCLRARMRLTLARHPCRRRRVGLGDSWHPERVDALPIDIVAKVATSLQQDQTVGAHSAVLRPRTGDRSVFVDLRSRPNRERSTVVAIPLLR